jgi:hypothetical protein
VVTKPYITRKIVEVETTRADLLAENLIGNAMTLFPHSVLAFKVIQQWSSQTMIW